MATVLKNTIAVTALAPATPTAFPHGLVDPNGAGYVPDLISLGDPDLAFVSADDTTVTLRNDGGAPVTTAVYVEHWHSYNRAIPPGITALTPQPVVIGGSGAGGGSISEPRTCFVYQPGGVASQNVYTDWAAMFAAIGNVAGCKTVFIDDTFDPTPTVPAGVWNVDDVLFTAPPRLAIAGPPGVPLSFADGAFLIAPLTTTWSFDRVGIVNGSTTSPIVMQGLVVNRVVLTRQAGIATTTAAPMIEVDGSVGLSFGVIDMDFNSAIASVASGFSADPVGVNGNGGAALALILVKGGSTIEADALASDAAGGIDIQWGSAIPNNVQPDQSSLLGSLDQIPQEPANDLLLFAGASQEYNRYGASVDGLAQFIDAISDARASGALNRVHFRGDTVNIGQILDLGDAAEALGKFGPASAARRYPTLADLSFSAGDFRNQIYRRLRLTNAGSTVLGVQKNTYLMEFCELFSNPGQGEVLVTTASPPMRFLFVGGQSAVRGLPGPPAILVDVGNPFTIYLGEGAVVEEDAISGPVGATVNIVPLSSSYVLKPQSTFLGTLNLLPAAIEPRHSDRMAIPPVDTLVGIPGALHEIDTSGGPVAVTLPLSTLENRGQPITLSKLATGDVNALSGTPSGGDSIIGPSSTSTDSGSITWKSNGQGSWRTTAVI
jgi:hypothetical protein